MSGEGVQGPQTGSAGSSSGESLRVGPSDLAFAFRARVEIDDILRAYPYMGIAIRSIVENHAKTHTTLREVMDQLALRAREANPDAPPRHVGTRAGAQVSARQRDTAESQRADLAAVRQERYKARQECDESRRELRDE